MDFSIDQIYHVFNRSNNSQLVFQDRENYLYFLSKISEYIRPHAEILAWCLMPTHFHLMIEVVNDHVVVASGSMNVASDPMTGVHRISNRDEVSTHPMNPSHRMS